jgi:hypothetical protein
LSGAANSLNAALPKDDPLRVRLDPVFKEAVVFYQKRPKATNPQTSCDTPAAKNTWRNDGQDMHG